MLPCIYFSCSERALESDTERDTASTSRNDVAANVRFERHRIGSYLFGIDEEAVSAREGDNKRPQPDVPIPSILS